MTTVVANLLGWGTLLVGAAALTAILLRRAAAFGLLAPVVCGGALRLIVAVLAHSGSLKLGDHGLMFLDDQGYLQRGGLLSHLWAAGHTPDPAGYDVVGTYQFGYQAFLGGLFLLGAPSVVIGKLANVLLGTATVLLTGRLSARLLGEAAAARAAWLAALAPTMIWWSAPMMKEALATFLLTGALLAAAWLPHPRAIRWLVAALTALILVRVPAALAVVLTTSLLIAVVARKAEGRWLSRSLLASGMLALVGALLAAALLSGGRIHGLVGAYASTIDRMVDQYQGSNPARIPLDFVKTMVTPLPWVFDTGTRNWDRGLYPGVWLLYCAYPLALMGAWRLRRHTAAVILLAPILSTVLVNAVTAGFTFRQRSMIEPLVLLLAVAGARSARQAATLASFALAAAAVAATVQSRSPLLGLLILGAAAIALIISRRLSDAPATVAADDGPLIAGFAAITPARRRSGFAGLVEDSVAGLAVMRRRARAPRAPALAATLQMPLRDLRGDAPRPARAASLPSGVSLLGAWSSLRRLGAERLGWPRRLLSAAAIEVGVLRLEAPRPQPPVLEAISPAVGRASLRPPVVAAAVSPVAIRVLRLHFVPPGATPATPRTPVNDGLLTVELGKLRRAAPAVRKPRRP